MSAAAHPQPVCTVVSEGVWGVAPGCGCLRKCCGGRMPLQRFSNLKVPEETHSLEDSPRQPLHILPAACLSQGRREGSHHHAWPVRTLSKVMGWGSGDGVKCREGTQLRVTGPAHSSWKAFSLKSWGASLCLWSDSSSLGCWCFLPIPVTCKAWAGVSTVAQSLGSERFFTDMKARVAMLGCVRPPSSPCTKWGASNLFSHQVWWAPIMHQAWS